MQIERAYVQEETMHLFMKLNEVKQKLTQSKLAKDSFWAVFGNGFGNALLLLAGIVIARLLGKDIYGEYGLVKTTMLYIAGFATFGLGLTSTKYIAYYYQDKSQHLGILIRDSLQITLAFSGFIALLLTIFAHALAVYLHEENLTLVFRLLGVIIIAKACITTQNGILAGVKRFKTIAQNSMLSGVLMLILSSALTYIFGLKGAISALLVTQLFNAFINQISLHKVLTSIEKAKPVDRTSFKSELIRFSFPIALQESSFTICNWLGVMILTRLSTTGEVGLYTAAGQWNAIILFIPNLLINVVLSYLSGSVNNQDEHKRTIQKMLAVNFGCTLIPFLIVYTLAGFISSLYGPTFVDLTPVLRILTFTTIFECCSQVFRSEFIARGMTWIVFYIRFFRDVIIVIALYESLIWTEGLSGAYTFAIISLVATIFNFIVLGALYKYIASSNRVIIP